MLDSVASKLRSSKALNGGACQRAASFLVHHRATQRRLGVVLSALDNKQHDSNQKVPPLRSSRLDSPVQEYQDISQSEHQRYIGKDREIKLALWGMRPGTSMMWVVCWYAAYPPRFWGRHAAMLIRKQAAGNAFPISKQHACPS